MRHPSITFMIEKQINHPIPLFDVFITGMDNQNITLQKYHISTIKDFS